VSARRGRTVETIAIAIDRELRARVDALAQYIGCSRSALICNLIERELAQIPSIDVIEPGAAPIDQLVLPLPHGGPSSWPSLAGPAP
jgi:hypothetical protein